VPRRSAPAGGSAGRRGPCNKAARRRAGGRACEKWHASAAASANTTVAPSSSGHRRGRGAAPAASAQRARPSAPSGSGAWRSSGRPGARRGARTPDSSVISSATTCTRVGVRVSSMTTWESTAPLAPAQPPSRRHGRPATARFAPGMAASDAASAPAGSERAGSGARRDMLTPPRARQPADRPRALV